MPSSKSSLIKLDRLTTPKIEKLFSDSMTLKQNFNKHQLSSGVYHSGYKGTAALLFFEPSTRTRFSFEAACSRAGYHPLILDGGVGTSLEKGETIEDTIYNIRAMRPMFFIVRCNDLVNLNEIDASISEPVLNAGWGRQGHPTQALLDTLTMFEKWNTLKGKNILFVGDIKHSRVVSSHLELAPILGYKIGFSAPPELLPSVKPQCEVFTKLDDGLNWADAVIALRVQKERHDSENIFLLEDYREAYGLNLKRIQALKQDGLIMHPGPINYGIELESEILSDPRSCILKQVENGVFLREAIIRGLFN
ncbi:MAG: aspartate carbamoyltransferase [Pseudobdellovibrio sp.]|nr:aspartate carbamoyltransferase [Pseudobdellovibrio sp.]